MPGTVKTTRLRKLECPDCGYVARVSRSWIARGLPGCPCGGRLVPAELEDALAAHASGHLSDAELETHPEHEEYRRAVASVFHGQSAHVQNGRRLKNELRAPETIALERVHAGRALERNRARHAALAAHAFGASDKAADAAAMPF